MAQPSFTAVRQALAAALATIPGLNTYAEYAEQITVPAAIVLPVQGSFLRYATMDRALDISLRAVLAVAKAGGSAGQVPMAPCLAPPSPTSAAAPLNAKSSLGGVIPYPNLSKTGNYGPGTS